MPIEVATQIRVFDQEEFHALDKKLMRMVFDVQNEFLSTKLTPDKRRQFSVVDSAWQAVNEESSWLRSKVMALLNDWGAFLEVSLYRDALTNFLGGPHPVTRAVPVYSGPRVLGEQKVYLLANDTAFALTAVTAQQSSMLEHQARFLKHTPLRF